MAPELGLIPNGYENQDPDLNKVGSGPQHWSKPEVGKVTLVSVTVLKRYIKALML